MADLAIDEPRPEKSPKKIRRLSERELKARVLSAYEKTKEGMIEHIESLYQFGLYWNDMVTHIKDTLHQKLEDWIVENPLPFSYGYATGCGRMAAKYYQDFEEAHTWRLSEESKEWPPTENGSGWEYVQQVVRQWRQYQHKLENAESAPTPPKPMAKARSKVSDRTAEADNEEFQEGQDAEDHVASVATAYNMHDSSGSDRSDVVPFSDASDRDILRARRATLEIEIHMLETELTNRKAELAEIDRILNRPMH